MKLLILALMTFSSAIFANSIECEVTRNDYLMDVNNPTSLTFSLNKKGCQDVSLPNTDAGQDNFNYEVCLRKNVVAIKIYPGKSSRGNGLFKAAVARSEFELSEIRDEIALIQNVTINCR